MAKVYTSILNADWLHLTEVLDSIAASGADGVHYDVMDGCFVDNLSYGLPILHSMQQYNRLPVDAHLMVKEPLRFVERFAAEGTQMLSFHIESDSEPHATIAEIHRCGMRAGIAVSPNTPLERALPYLERLQAEDFVLLMTVEPGWGKQAFISEVLSKIEQLHTYLQTHSLPLHIQVDGGITAETAALCRAAGADYLVSGSYLLGAADPKAAGASLHEK